MEFALGLVGPAQILGQNDGAIQVDLLRATDATFNGLPVRSQCCVIAPSVLLQIRQVVPTVWQVRIRGEQLLVCLDRLLHTASPKQT